MVTDEAGRGVRERLGVSGAGGELARTLIRLAAGKSAGSETDGSRWVLGGNLEALQCEHAQVG